MHRPSVASHICWDVPLYQAAKALAEEATRKSESDRGPEKQFDGVFDYVMHKCCEDQGVDPITGLRKQ